MRRLGWVLHCSVLAWCLCLMQASVAHAAPADAGVPAADAALIMVLGDSLSAEYGIERGQGWVALLEQRLARSKPRAKVLNASISGDTTSGGRSRLPALLAKHRPSHVLIELGGNDALRGLPLTMTQANLAAMLQACRAAGARPILIGMRMPPNYGKQYVDEFAALFSQLAKSEAVPLVPFLLQGVAERADAQDWFQADRIHPLAKAHPQMLDNVWVVLKKTL